MVLCALGLQRRKLLGLLRGENPLSSETFVRGGLQSPPPSTAVWQTRPRELLQKLNMSDLLQNTTWAGKSRTG